ncbi:helix-turn-helix transcriptional regulator [Streptomyces sp. NRRL S-87]|uniref:helix-turn-helix transcriptional regulator n=1 Tax=Streptomyces sp. NRRL S-87 TaxID=1463920 RepID=UPI0004C16261|nr:helix-turn-helix transcriptional regulator [Streptomyces sp. NRRL S-87]
MDRKAELGAFLRSRRARLSPEEAGLPRFGGRRRVPGLRREELARLAGVSTDYYVRLEQGRADNVSDEVVAAVAAALRLDGPERAHLHRLVRGAPARPAGSAGPAAPQTVRPGLRRLLESMPGTPACVLGRRTDILAWNPLYAALFTDLDALPAERRNKLWLLFTHPQWRDRFADPEAKAACLTSFFRLERGRHPDDPGYDALVAELSAQSPRFRALWAEHEVCDSTHGSWTLRHPAVGEVTLAYETLRLPDDPDQLLITYTTEPASPSESALRALAPPLPVDA